jgi:tetratricopeptide (TPR) repeat protein
MISDRPLSGFGLEQMGYWFPAYKTPRHATIEPRTVEDHAHNDLLQAAVTMGIPGLLLYIWMFTMAILTLLKERETSSYAMGLFAAITGYVIQAQVGIPAVFISPVIWALLGISMGVTQHGRRVEVAFPRWFKPQVAIYIIGVAFAGLSLFALKPIIADIHIYKGQRIANTSFNRALPEFETAIRLYPYQTAYARAASEFYLDYANSPQNSIFAQRASLIAEQGLHYNKRDFELAYMVGTANLRSYKFTENDMALSKAERYFGQVEKLWPSLLLVKEGLFEVAFEKGDMKEAAVRAEELVRMGEEDPKAYYVLATEAQKKGEHKKAERYFKKMEELRTKSPQGM